ncbi:NAD+ synthase [Pilimelia anulata]|uniref:Glutamine-dependent NAD(+) synthetase n=1 Tax=Pilimelia anulata TaxID=53371 RepID=A0A8J3B0T8_9ACTN|nr:NAD+ synthase [Pilimelia anulata]GGJ84552.1 NAD+ synthase [Pilimelia anulata]
MVTLRVALAQVNPVVGDIDGNAALLHRAARAGADAGANLVLTPELGLTGYPPEDLVFRRSFLAAAGAALTELAKTLANDELGDLPVVVGFPDVDRAGPGAPARRRNTAAVLHGGRVAARYHKHHLPNYGVFDEGRYFTPGDVLTVVRVPAGGAAVDVALTVCEDLWQAGGPFAVARSAGAGLVVSINASPYERDKDDLRLPLVARRAAEAAAPIAYVNAVGGQDELVFDGDSMVVAADGTLLARAPQFADHLLVHDLDLPAATDRPEQVPLVAPPGAPMVVHRVALGDPVRAVGAGTAAGGIAPPLDDVAQVWGALVLGLRDYVGKNGFGSVTLGLSGGIDSSVVAALAVDAVGPERVHGVAMPSRYSSAHSLDDAADLARRTGCRYRVVPIQEMVDQFLTHLGLSGLAVENLQARVRGVILMGLSNQEGHLVLTTGNKSELAVGYSTLYGDSVGGFNPLKDVPKTLVWELARWRNADAAARGQVPPIPEHAITKPPSAELRPDQRDSDSLPDYPVLDAILAGYVDGDAGRAELVAAGHDPALVDRVLRLVDGAEYKRRQAAPGTKISMKAFGRDRRLPLTNRFRER